MSVAVVPFAPPAPSSALDNQIESVLAALDRDGAVTLPQLVSADTLKDMQAEFGARLKYFATNDVTGYVHTELMRVGVPDVLTLAQGFIDIGVHSLVMGVMERYVGKAYALAEAKGWETQRTLSDFHGWHGDSWYDQQTIKDRIPREAKLAFYLTDVNSGAFQYIKGSHRKQTPSLLKKHEAAQLPMGDMLEFKGVAGTAVVFDTSGIHRQGVPVLDPRRAVFYNYHDVDVPLQKADVDYYRYHPLTLSAAFLGGLTSEQYRVLGFGHKGRLQPGFIRKPQHRALHAIMAGANTAQLHFDHNWGRVRGKIERMLKAKG